jgi:hypothetical protein
VELAAEPAAEPAKTEPVEPAKAEPVVMKKIVKKKQQVVPVVPVVPVEPVVPVVPVESNASASNEKIIRKKIAPTKQPQATQEPQQATQEPQEPKCTDSERTDSVSYNSHDSLQMDATVIKKKIIRKKIAPEAQEPQEPQEPQVQIAPADATAVKKIIRKKK